jgi:DNA-binding SARP family transcriptional activator/tetratricopeptide (TPR) repeat protein
MRQLSLDLLGSFYARLDDKPLTAFRSVKVQGLLAYLVLNSQQPHSRDVLAALFWPEEPDSVAKQNLRQSLYQLRQVLDDTDSEEGAFLLVTRSTVQFNPASDYTLDVAAFLTSLEDGDAERAVELYRGDLLPGLACDSAAFEHWLSQEREHLHQIALETLAGLADRSLAEGAYHDAQNFARQQLELEPWREIAHRQMMQSLALLGERSAALAQYETCRAVLEAEFGAEPAAETQTLAERIREQELEGKAGPAGPARRLFAVPFVGRASEHTALVEAFQRACDGDARVITLIGEAGIGKTRLAEHFLNWAATQGADIVSGYAFESSGRLSYQPLIHALRKRLERENAPEDLLSDLWLTQLARILPELRDRYPDLPVPTQEENTARQHLSEAIARLGLALAARAPVIFFIDDWHWADGGSMDALHYAARRWSEERARILTILPLREKELTQSPDLQNWLTHLSHDVCRDEVRLGTLSHAETGQLIHALTGASLEDEMARLPEFCDWLYNETDGQSLFVVETLKALVEDSVFRPAPQTDQWRIDWSQFDEQLLHSRVPPGIQEIIRGWLDRVSEPARDVLSAVAVLGEKATFDNLRNVVDMDETQAIEALDQLLLRQLLQESEQDSLSQVDDPVYRFAHHKLRETIYDRAGAARRRILHRRAFDTLQYASAPSAELAYHALHARMMAEAARYSIAAGNEAMRLFAVRDAITHFEAVVQLTQESGWSEALSGADRQDLYLGLGRAYELIEMWPQAAGIYQQMIDYARSIHAGTVECLGLNHLATVCINGLKDRQRAVMLLEQAGSIAEQNGDRRGLAETEWNLSAAARMAQDTYAAQHHGERALTIARELHHPQLLARCLNGLAYVNARLRRWDRVEVYAREARDIYATAGNRVLEMDNQRLIAWSQAFLGYPEASLDVLREALDFSQQIENVWGMAECRWRMAQNLLDLGRYGEAVMLAPQAVGQARLVGQPTMFVMALTTWGAVQRTMKAWDAARDTLLEALAEYSDKVLTGFQDWILSELCTLSAQNGDWSQAHTYARQNAQLMWDDSLLPITMAAWYETEALLRGGDGDLARAEVQRLRALAGDNKRFRLVASRCMAVLAAWDRNFDAAIRHLCVALALAQDIGYLGQEQSILVALGDLYEEQGNDSAADEARGKATTITRRLAESINDPHVRATFLGGNT